MRVKSRCGFFTVAVLSLSLSHLPNVVLAETIQAQKKMISTSEMLENFNRKLAQEKVANFLSQKDVELKLVEQGVSLAEAKARVMSLSDQELQNLSTQVDKAQYGGDILVTILLIVLIIFLIKRI
ncbi:MAG: PA2779 family protein [Pseudobdellovibrio sp.]|nr:PA2779 family protein [Pseudobdellovibrio sp.]